MNYQRLIQWLAGPVSAGVAYASTKLVHATISHNAALNVATFVVGGAVTYLAHAKWLDNLVEWWKHNETPAIGDDPTIGAGSGFVFGDPTATTEADKLRAQLRSHGLEPRA